MRPIATLVTAALALTACTAPGETGPYAVLVDSVTGVEGGAAFARIGRSDRPASLAAPMVAQERAATVAGAAVLFPRSSVAASMVIRTGQASIEVDSLERAVAHVRQLAERIGGYLANTAMQTGRGQLRSACLEVKIPADRFNDGLGGLAGLGKLESVNVNAEDVPAAPTTWNCTIATGPAPVNGCALLIVTRTCPGVAVSTESDAPNEIAVVVAPDT